LSQHPQRDIAQYHGCEVDNGYVTVLCFKKIPTTSIVNSIPAVLTRPPFRKVSAHRWRTRNAISRVSKATTMIIEEDKDEDDDEDDE